MIRILLHGCGGHMGKTVAETVAARNDCLIAAGVDPAADGDFPFPVYRTLSSVDTPFDVILDFSVSGALNGLLDFAAKADKPLVLCTTGYDDTQIEMINEASKSIPIFFSYNMSLGISLLTELAVTAANVLGDDFDIEIIEKHHHAKVDAPSGTACHLADAINKARQEKYRYVYDRHAIRAKRDPAEIGIHSVRGGTMVGEHEILFAGNDEVLTLSHTAQSKKIFANGAVNAVLFMAEKPSGLYKMADLIRK